MDYSEEYIKFKEFLLEKKPRRTRMITKLIKEYFEFRFSSDYHVLSNLNGEYLTDVMVTTFHPRQVLQTRTLDVIPAQFNGYFAVESELGGVSASSAYGVMKNVVEDFCKLLLIQSEYKMLIFTSLPYANENQHIENRVNTLMEIYRQSTITNENGILVVHLSGSQKGRSTQVQVTISKRNIKGFFLHPNGTIQSIDA